MNSPNPTAEDLIAEALQDMWPDSTLFGDPWSPESHEVVSIASKLHAHNLLSEGAPSEEPVEEHVSRIARDLARASELTGANAEVIAKAALKLAAGVAPQKPQALDPENVKAWLQREFGSVLAHDPHNPDRFWGGSADALCVAYTEGKLT